MPWNAAGKADNTWIIFTADHGWRWEHHDCSASQTCRTQSAGTIYHRGPQLQPQWKPSPIYLQDAMATALELAGIARPESCEFSSVLELAKSSKQVGRAQRDLWRLSLKLQRCVIHDGWKLDRLSASGPRCACIISPPTRMR